MKTFCYDTMTCRNISIFFCSLDLKRKAKEKNSFSLFFSCWHMFLRFPSRIKFLAPRKVVKTGEIPSRASSVEEDKHGPGQCQDFQRSLYKTTIYLWQAEMENVEPSSSFEPFRTICCYMSGIE